MYSPHVIHHHTDESIQFTVNTSWVDEQGDVQVAAKQYAHTVLAIQLQVV